MLGLAHMRSPVLQPKKARASGLFGNIYAKKRKQKCYARTTLPAFKHLVQMFALRTWPLSLMVTFCTFGRNVRLDTRCEWLMLRPATGAFPHTSQTLDISINSEFFLQYNCFFRISHRTITHNIEAVQE